MTRPEFLDYTFLGNTTLDWALAALAFVFTFFILPLIRGWISALHRRRMKRAQPDGSGATTHTAAVSLTLLLVARTSKLLLVVLAVYLAESILTLPPRVDRAFDIVIICGAWLQVGLWASTALRFWIERRGSSDTGALVEKTSVAIIMFIAQLLIWSLLALLALDNLGVNITALVAGLGVSGIAVALAVQTVLGDIFASLSIAFDKPFAIGDTLTIDEHTGTVEHVGLKSTRIRSVNGEQIIISNADVLKSRVRNMGRMQERRLLFKLYIPYDVDVSKLDAIEPMVMKAVTSHRDARFVQCLLTNLGAYAMEFEVIWYVSNAKGVDGNRVVDTVNRTIVKDLARQGLRLTYPTNRILMKEEKSAEGGGESSPPPANVKPDTN